jgi:FKBP-type peptidyl-prolyl cis-trans isomerase 2
MSNEGKKVSVHYTGTLDDGTKFDSSYDRNQPLEFTCMAGQMIKGFDEAVRDMEVGQTVNIHLEPSEAYGERREDLIYEFPMEQVPEDMHSLKVGEHVMLQGPMGQPIPAVVSKVTPSSIFVDLNHEMAGKALNFEITLLSAE